MKELFVIVALAGASFACANAVALLRSEAVEAAKIRHEALYWNQVVVARCAGDFSE